MIRDCVVVNDIWIALLVKLAGLVGVRISAAGPVFVGLHPVMVVAVVMGIAVKVINF